MLALARVELADPQLVILDEPTAVAGSADAYRLDHATQAVLRGRTGLIVAHRLGHDETADRIVVLPTAASSSPARTTSSSPPTACTRSFGAPAR